MPATLDRSAVMGISIRIYLFAEDGTLKRVPRRICEALPFGEDSIPEYAGTRQRVVQVIIENEDGRPARILDASGHFWTFNAEGKIDEGLRESLREFMEVAYERPRDAEGKVVDLVPEIKKKELYDRQLWTLTKEDVERIAADVQGGNSGRAAAVTTVRGTAPNKPPVNRDAKRALTKLVDHVMAINRVLDMLSEGELKGVAFEAISSNTPDDEAIWNGISREATRRQAIRAAHRTGKGEWYAVVEVARGHPTHPHLWEHVSDAYVKCASRKDAVKAGRQLMAEKACSLDANIEISVNVRSALEWRPDDWE